MTGKESDKPADQRAANRRKRQAAALRANLKRRKEASQAPQPPEDNDPDHDT